ncbi:MAG TPA: VWA domain-containing protein [Candidatus Janibacter merdipullorum]|nr:VWA domain-containing protein [Candidatus Janibacter merdipullorum]
MNLAWWWMPLVLIPVVLVIAGLGWWLAGRESAKGDSVPVAHTRRLTRLPAYRAALGRQQMRLVGLAVIVGVTLLPLTIAAARPGTEQTIDPEKRNRDIMLCLDVSGSMFATDRAVLNNFSEIVKNFEGERIGLMLFNNQTVTAFPLTDDYELVSEQLEGYADGFSYYSDSEYDPVTGTANPRIPASSLVGDGLASCVQGFDHADEERPRAVILGSDNEVHGSGVYTLGEAADLAKENNVRVYALNPMAQGSNHAQLSEATERTGGRAWALDSSGSTEDVTESIEELETARLPDVAPVHVRTDLPTVPMVLALLGLLCLYPLLWWWRR